VRARQRVPFVVEGVTADGPVDGVGEVDGLGDDVGEVSAEAGFDDVGVCGRQYRDDETRTHGVLDHGSSSRDPIGSSTVKPGGGHVAKRGHMHSSASSRPHGQGG
jgi:hypothetical protein